MARQRSRPAPVPSQSAPHSAPPMVDKSRTIQVSLKPGENHDRAMAGIVARGMVTNASTVIRFEAHEHEGLSLIEMTRELEAQGAAVNRGDLASLEQTLTAQALSLNAIFGELARIAKCNIYTLPDVAERYLRIALKAQGQCRATVETLADIKNPPLVFARQMNVANGPQQVNNGAARNSTPASTRPGETVSAQTELLEDTTHGRTQLDTRAAPATSRAHTPLEPVGAVNRPAHGGG